MRWALRHLRSLWKGRERDSGIHPATHGEPAVSPGAPRDHGPFPQEAVDSSRSAILSLFHCVLARDARHAAESVAGLMNTVRLGEWSRLYRELRWIPIKRYHIAKLAAHPGDIAVELLGIATLNSDGYVRQAALEGLAATGHPRALPYVLLRLTDWVPQVRETAHHVLELLLAQGLASAILDHSDLVDGLHRAKRADLSEAREQILTFLRGAQCREEVLRRIGEADPKMRLFCYRLVEAEIPSNPDLITRALADPSPAIRRWIVRSVLNAPEDQAVQWLPRLLTDPSVRVRTEALHGLPERLWTSAEALVEQQMYAAAPSVRQAARFLLKAHGIGDFAVRYRQRIAPGKEIYAGTVAGLGETGDAQDFDRIVAHRCHPKAKVREAVITSLGRLGGELAMVWAVQALDDTNGRVRRAAVAVLSRVGAGLAREAVRTVLEYGPPPSKLAALTVLAGMGGWEALRDIVSALVCEDQKVSASAWEHLSSWWGRRASRLYGSPSPPIAEVLRQLTPRVHPPDSKRASVWKRACDFIAWTQRGG